MSTMNGNTHFDAAALYRPQLTTEETANEHYLAEQGITDETMQFSALNRLAEATLALAYEQRTANLIAKLALNVQTANQNCGLGSGAVALDHEILTRLGLTEGTKS